MRKTIAILITCLFTLAGTFVQAQDAGVIAVFDNDKVAEHVGTITVCEFILRYSDEGQLKEIQDLAGRFAPSRELTIGPTGETERDCKLVFASRVPEISVHKMLLAYNIQKVIYQGTEMDLDTFRTKLGTSIE